MKHSSLALAGALLLGVSSVRAEPVTVTPGDGTVDGSFIVAYENAWTMTRRDAEGIESPAGRWTDQVEIIEHEGRHAIKRTQLIYAPDGQLQHTAINIVDHQTLAPISATMTTPEGFVHSDEFDGANVAGSIQRSEGAAAQTYEHEVERAAFDWSIYGTLLIGFPLEVGYAARFPTFVISPGSTEVTVDWVEFEVVGQETVSAGAKGEMETFAIDVTQPDAKFHFNLTKEAPYIIKLVYEQPDGATTTWDME